MEIREARPEDAAGIASVHVESWRTTYRGIVPQAFLDGLSVEGRTRWWEAMFARADSRRCVFVAEGEDGQIIGFAFAGPESRGDRVYTGEVYAIYLLEQHQRRGIGRRLMSAAVERLSALGMTGMLLWVLADNHPSRRFYEALGGVELRTEQIELAGAELDEVAYGWRDAAALAAALRR
jgi:L-amino acid N-acyltransferase YncA